MERFRVAASYNGSSLPQKPPNFVPFPRKTHHHHFRPETPKPTTAATATGDRRGSASCDTDDETEISIFDAERYFKEEQITTEIDLHHHKNPNKITSLPLEQVLDLSANYQRDSSVSSVDGYGRNFHRSCSSFHVTPTAPSEASWNSRSGLLSNPPGSVAVKIRSFPLNKQRRGSSSSSSSSKWLFGRNCPCAGRKEVEVEGKFSSSQPNRSPDEESKFDSIGSVSLKKQSCPKTGDIVANGVEEEFAKLKLAAEKWVSPEKHFPAEIGRHRIVNSGGGFSFPVLTHPSAATAKPSNGVEDPPRDSLEVFQPPAEEMMVLRKSLDFQRRAAAVMLFAGSDNNPRRSFTFSASPTAARVAALDDDVSDSSSDLFEIESFSTPATSYRRRDSLDEMAAAKFAGGILQAAAAIEPPSDCCYPPSEVSVEWSVMTAEGFDRSSVANFSSAGSDSYENVKFAPEVFAGGGGGKRRGNGLLSCRSEKAVSVGPHPVRFGPEQNITHVPRDPRPPLARSHSGRMSQPLPA